MAFEEFKGVSQDRGSFRRLFADEVFDLYFWYRDDHLTISGFQLVMRETYHAFTWEVGKGGLFTGVMAKGTPFLTVNGRMPKAEWLKAFRSRAEGLDPEVVDLVAQSIQEFTD